MNKKLLMWVVIIVLLVGGFKYFSNKKGGSFYQTGKKMSEKGQITVNLAEQNDSGQTGTAMLVEKDGKLMVTLSTSGGGGVSQPAHIHVGACPDVGGVEYPLTNVVNGASETTLETTLAQLESQAPFAINIHKSASEASVYTACGDLAF